MDDKLKYHDILLQNQKWVYSAPRPSADYWGTLEEEEENEAEDFLEQIKKCTEEMRYGTGNGEIVLNTRSFISIKCFYLIGKSLQMP